MDIIEDFSLPGRVVIALAVPIALACNPDDGTPSFPDTSTDASDTTTTDGTVDPGLDDGGPTSCTSHADCDDGIACTDDLCTVSGTCQNTARDDLCPSGQHCSTTEGCVEGCDEDADCQNGLWCDGDERCIGMNCFPGTARDCNDGNSCTIDTCVEETDSCQYELYPECETDAPTDTSGEPFDPAVHYSGLFDTAPMISQECTINYYISQMTFSSDGSTLTITAPPFTLTQTPVPSDGNFSASGSNSCFSVTLTGNFVDSDNFIADWTATVTGSCPSCTYQSRTIAGTRF